MTNLGKLLRHLNDTGLQEKDTPLYQFLKELIRTLNSVNNAISSISGGSSVVTNKIIQNTLGLVDGIDGQDGLSIIGPQGPKGNDGLSLGLLALTEISDGRDEQILPYPILIGPFKIGSVIFWSGKLSEDNDNFFWDDTNNRLGIGTTSPSAKLHVTDKIIVVAPASAIGIEMRGRSSDNTSYESFRSNDGATEYGFIQADPNEFYIGNDNSSSTGGLHFYVKNVEKLTILNGGNVGVGTTSPGKLLDVNGTVNISGIATLGAPITLKGYTVATLPAGVVGHLAYCTDLLAPAFLAVAAGGGTVTGPVFYNGTNWVTI